MKSKKIIIVGASSGIGRSLAEKCIQEGHQVGICARRRTLLDEMNKTNKYKVATMDVANYADAVAVFHQLIDELGGVDIVVLNAGVLIHEKTWQKELETVQINSCGFLVLANEAFSYFSEKGSGQIVGLSSIAGLRGFAENPAYCASKALVTNYLQALSQRAFAKKLKVRITDVVAGFVISDMTIKRKMKFWTCSSEKAARIIYKGLLKKRRFVYVSRRWILVAYVVRWLPTFIFERLPVQLENTYYE